MHFLQLNLRSPLSTVLSWWRFSAKAQIANAPCKVNNSLKRSFACNAQKNRFPISHLEADHGPRPRNPIGEGYKRRFIPSRVFHEGDGLLGGGVELLAAVPGQVTDDGHRVGARAGGEVLVGLRVGETACWQIWVQDRLFVIEVFFLREPLPQRVSCHNQESALKAYFIKTEWTRFLCWLSAYSVTLFFFNKALKVCAGVV